MSGSEQITDVVASSLLVGVTPTFSHRCKRAYERVCARLQWLRGHNAKIQDHQITISLILWFILIMLILINGILFIRVTSNSTSYIQRMTSYTDTVRRVNCLHGFGINKRTRYYVPDNIALELSKNFIIRLLSGRSVHRCVKCPPGSYSSNNQCKPCSAGTYQAQYGALSCEECAPGTSQGEVGQALCEECSPGYYQPYHGSPSCLQCPPSTYQPSAGSLDCVECTQCGVEPSDEGFRDSELSCPFIECPEISFAQKLKAIVAPPAPPPAQPTPLRHTKPVILKPKPQPEPVVHKPKSYTKPIIVHQPVLIVKPPPSPPKKQVKKPTKIIEMKAEKPVPEPKPKVQEESVIINKTVINIIIRAETAKIAQKSKTKTEDNISGTTLETKEVPKTQPVVPISPPKPTSFTPETKPAQKLKKRTEYPLLKQLAITVKKVITHNMVKPQRKTRLDETKEEPDCELKMYFLPLNEVSMFDDIIQFCDHVYIVTSGEISISSARLVITAMLCYLTFLWLLMKKVIVGVQCNVYSHFTLLSEIVTCVFLILTVPPLKGVFRPLIQTPLILCTYYTLTFRLLDNISKMYQNRFNQRKRIASLLLPPLLTLLELYYLEHTRTEKRYDVGEDYTVMRIMLGSRLLLFPVVITRIDVVLDRVRSNKEVYLTIREISKIEVISEVVKMAQIGRLIYQPDYYTFIATFSLDVISTMTSTLLLECVPENAKDLVKVAEEEREELEITTTIKEIRYVTQHFVRITAEDVIMYFRNENPEQFQQEEDEELLFLEKEEMYFNQYRLDNNRDIVVYINKTVVEECVNFTSTIECKLYLAQMTGSSDSLAQILRNGNAESETECQIIQEEKLEESDESNGFVVLVIPEIIYTDETTPLENSDSSCECEHTTISPKTRRSKSAEPTSRGQKGVTSAGKVSSVSTSNINTLSRKVTRRRRSLPTEEVLLFSSTSCLGCRKTAL